MGLFKKNKKLGIISDIIRCDEQSYLIWKWHPDGTDPKEHKREYAIRCGSQLRVKDGEVAVFVYKQKDGAMQDFIEGPFDQKLKTANFPVLSGILGAFFGGDTPFQAEVYFINLAGVIQIRFGIPFFDVFDPRHPDFGVPVAVRGSLTFKVKDYKEFIKLHRLIDFSLEDFKGQVLDAIIRYTKDVVANAPIDNNIPLVQIERKTRLINDKLEQLVLDRFYNDFGVQVTGVDLNAIEIDKGSSNYAELLSVTKELTGMTVTAQAEANIKNIYEKQQIELEHYQDSLRIQREETQFASHMGTQSKNINVIRLEKQAEVGVASAEALGKMGENGVGNISLGGGNDGGIGFNPITMMAGLAVGGVVGRNIADVLNTTMPKSEDLVPPPPQTVYHVAVNGSTTGPYELQIILQMIKDGKINANTLVWKQGMQAWAMANSFEELKNYFVPPVPPVQ